MSVSGGAVRTMVTPVAADSERRAVSVMLSWLNLDYKELDFSKCTKYSMPRDVKAAINSAAFPRPKGSSPFPLVLTSQKEKSQKRKHAKSVLSADEGEGDVIDSADERESLAAKKKRGKDAREIRDLKKKLDDAEAALAAAAASKTVTVTSKIASKPQAAADSNQPSALLQPSLLVEFAVRTILNYT